VHPNKLKSLPIILTFLIPGTILFSIYVIYPILQSISLSLYDWDGLGEKEFIGLENYRELLSDPQFWVSLKNNVIWLVLLLLSPVFGLALALFLNQEVFGIRLLKSLFFFPFVISLIVVGLVFSWFYDPHYGVLNFILNKFSLPSLAILSNEKLVTYGIILSAFWPQVAYCMILYLTGLVNINSEQIESARIDRAKGFKMLWHIVLPNLRPATFIAIVVTVIGALRSFDLVAIMTAGGPYNQSSVLAYFMYEQTIFSYRVGYGAAIATVLFAIMSVYIVFFLYRMLQQEKS
jgi:multiple sugar transport system permease protein